ncbi:hypothetical protein B0H11DRAFT_2223334 [Mycena galericulata]|nr:hypothetical protein B0H11DRAFT_2250210 [Mycena galericulata]KAJ7502417.1 hypothetical protein B0H11DRAFT_2223334 [Mycena galericulata]
MTDRPPLPLSALRAAAYVHEAQQERERAGAPEFSWDFGLASRALRRYARPRLAKIQRAAWRRCERLRYEQALLNPPPRLGPWHPDPWPTPTTPDASPAWATLDWKDIDTARHLHESDDEISPAVVTRPLPLAVNYFYDYY